MFRSREESHDIGSRVALENRTAEKRRRFELTQRLRREHVASIMGDNPTKPNGMEIIIGEGDVSHTSTGIAKDAIRVLDLTSTPS